MPCLCSVLYLTNRNRTVFCQQPPVCQQPCVWPCPDNHITYFLIEHEMEKVRRTVQRMFGWRLDAVSSNNEMCLCCLYCFGLLPSSSRCEEGCCPFVSVWWGFLPQKNKYTHTHTQQARTQAGMCLFGLLNTLKIDQQRKRRRLSASDVTSGRCSPAHDAQQTR